jgi:hypothetical protein
MMEDGMRREGNLDGILRPVATPKNLIPSPDSAYCRFCICRVEICSIPENNNEEFNPDEMHLHCTIDAFPKNEKCKANRQIESTSNLKKIPSPENQIPEPVLEYCEKCIHRLEIRFPRNGAFEVPLDENTYRKRVHCTIDAFPKNEKCKANRLEPTLVDYPDSLYCAGCKDGSDKGLFLGQVGCRLGALPRSKACIDKWGDKAPEWWVKKYDFWKSIRQPDLVGPTLVDYPGSIRCMGCLERISDDTLKNGQVKCGVGTSPDSDACKEARKGQEKVEADLVDLEPMPRWLWEKHRSESICNIVGLYLERRCAVPEHLISELEKWCHYWQTKVQEQEQEGHA